MTTKIRVMGVDMAFSNVGIAVCDVDLTDPKNPVIEVLDLMVIHTDSIKKRPRGMTKASDDLRRAREALQGLHTKIASWRPDVIVAEVPFGSQSARASWTLGIAIGVLASLTNIIEVTPRQVKTITGEAHADKAEMIEWAMSLHPDAPWAWRKFKGNMISVASTNEHTADALACVYAGLATAEFKERLRGIV